jgi:hypothetical protein
MAAILVTLAQAKLHLYKFEPPGDVLDPDAQLKLDVAEAKVLAQCSRTAASKAIADAWTSSTVPPQVVAAILLEFGEGMRYRGDDETRPVRDGEDVTPQVAALLRPFSDPVFA